MPALAALAIVGATIGRGANDNGNEDEAIVVPAVRGHDGEPGAGVGVGADVRLRRLWREEGLDAVVEPSPGLPAVEGGAVPTGQAGATGDVAPAPEPVVLPDPAEPAPEPVAAPVGVACIDIARASGIEEDNLWVSQIVCPMWPESEWWTMWRVIECESGGWREASSGISHGLFQLNGIHAARWPDFWPNVWDAQWNAEHAFIMWSEQGWGPWDCW